MNGTETSGRSAPSHELTSKRILVALLAAVAALGFFRAYLHAHGNPEPGALRIASTLVFSLLIFTWFWLDSEARAYKRSPFLSLAVGALAALAVPYYLLRSRPKCCC